MKKIFIQFLVFKAYAVDNHLEYSLIDDDNINVKVVVEVDEKILLTTFIKQREDISNLVKLFATWEVEKQLTLERMNFFEISNMKEKLKKEEKIFDKLVLESDTLLEKILSELFLHIGDVDYTVMLLDLNYREPHFLTINLNK